MITAAVAYSHIGVGVAFTLGTILAVAEAPVFLAVGVGIVLVGATFFILGGSMVYNSGVPELIGDKVTSWFK